MVVGGGTGVESEKLQGESFEAISDGVRLAKQASQSEEGYQWRGVARELGQAIDVGLPRLLGFFGLTATRFPARPRGRPAATSKRNPQLINLAKSPHITHVNLRSMVVFIGRGAAEVSSAGSFKSTWCLGPRTYLPTWQGGRTLGTEVGR